MLFTRSNRHISARLIFLFIIALLLGLLSINQHIVQANATPEQHDIGLLEIKQEA